MSPAPRQALRALAAKVIISGLSCAIGLGLGHADGAGPLRWPAAKRDIPREAPPGVRRAIEKMFSREPDERFRAAVVLGRFGRHAVAAIPFLLQVDDNSRPHAGRKFLDEVLTWGGAPSPTASAPPRSTR